MGFGPFAEDLCWSVLGSSFSAQFPDRAPREQCIIPQQRGYTDTIATLRVFDFHTTSFR